MTGRQRDQAYVQSGRQKGQRRTEGQLDWLTDRQGHRTIEGLVAGQAISRTGRQAGRQTDRPAGRQTDVQVDRQARR